MKKIYLLIAILLLSGSILMAQSPGNRRNQTIVADVMAQMPTSDKESFDRLMGNLASTGEEGVLSIINQFNAQGKGSNATAEYALSGLTFYLSSGNMEKERAAVVQGYLSAIDKITEPETKAFIIRQLGLIGNNESVDKLTTCLYDEAISGYAAGSLSLIGTEKAGQALLESLNKVTSNKSKRDIIVAIGEAQVENSESAIMPYLDKVNRDFDKVVLYTISRVGTKASLKTLKGKAAEANYTKDNKGATKAYISLLKRVYEQGNIADVNKESKKLLKEATSVGQEHCRIAALELIMLTDKSSKQVLTALKDKSSIYRNSALTFASGFAGERLYTDLFKFISSAKPDVKAEIMDWAARECESPVKQKIISAMQLSSKQTVVDLFVQQLASSDLAVKQSATNILVKIANPATIPALADMLTSTDDKVVAIGETALSIFNGNINTEVVRAISKAGDNGKKAGVRLLALRKASNMNNVVYDLIKSGSPDVKSAAYNALKDVVTANDFETLCKMLEVAETSEVAPLQQAIIASLKTLPANEQAEAITKKMNVAASGKQYLYYTALASTGEKSALDLIVSGFRNNNGSAKEAAFQALTEWKGFEVADELYAICTDPGASAYFDKAFAGYVSLASNQQMTGENRFTYLRNALEIAKTSQQKTRIMREIGRTNSFRALLFAGKYLDDSSLNTTAASAVMNIALNNKDFTGNVIKDLLNKVIGLLNNPDADYEKEAIRQHIAEMPDEDGFVQIFNGTDLTGWKGLVGNPITRAKMTPSQLRNEQAKSDELMRKEWTAENGMMIFDGDSYNNICTEKLYGDIEMYIDWKLDANGKEPDAGIYLRGTPQVQMWDISRVRSGAQVGSGGLYNNRVNRSTPLIVADNKLGEWNALYIKMTGDRVTVKLNGHLVVDDVILENYWDRSNPLPPIEQIELQAHGSKVYYRDIYVKELKNPEPFKLSLEEEKEGYTVLFDGTNMHQWTGNIVDYTIEEGNLVMNPSRDFGGNLYTKNEYDNFIFRFEFQLTPAANNGLGIRTSMEGDAAYVGMELQILDSEHPIYNDLQEYQYHGSVYGVIPAKRGFLKPVGEWNYQEVIANGDNIKITLNGTVILEGNLREASKNGTIDGLNHPGLLNKSGHIAFLGHGSYLKFRNIRIKKL